MPFTRIQFIGTSGLNDDHPLLKFGECGFRARPIADAMIQENGIPHTRYTLYCPHLSRPGVEVSGEQQE